MGKNKPELDGIIFDSSEELEFYHWVKEAIEYDFISGFTYNDISYDLSPKQTYTDVKKLKTKTKIVEKHLLHPHKYTPDFIIHPSNRWALIDSCKLIKSDGDIVIDIKGSFQKYDGSRSFSINQKWVYDKYEIYVNKVTPKDFFKSTWLPENCRYTAKTKKLRQPYSKIPTLFEKFKNID